VDKTPKKLSLRAALKATSDCLGRHGDLIQVVYHDGITGNDEHQIRGILVPSIIEQAEKRFPQPRTEQNVKRLYESGGWIESIAHYTDEELALYRDYQAGRKVSASGLVGDAGDPSQFETDFKEVLALLPGEWLTGVQGRTVVEVIKRTLLHQHKKYKVLSNLGGKHKKVSASGGKAAAKVNKATAASWHCDAEKRARKMLDDNVSPRDLAGKLAQTGIASKDRISRHLKKVGIK
jgi:hypothetical protein